MALAGAAVMAIWNDITPEGRAAFYEWHSREHMPERVGIPGFLRGRRYVGIEAEIEFFTLYETRSIDVLTGPDYKSRLNDPTPWSTATTAEFRNNLRGVCRVAFSAGHAEGAYLLAVRFAPAEGRGTELQVFLCSEALPPLLDLPEVTGAHLCLCDASASGTDTALQRQRRIGVPDWIVLVEGSTEDGIARAREALLAGRRLIARGAKPEIVPDLFRLEYSLAKIARSGASESVRHAP